MSEQSHCYGLPILRQQALLFEVFRAAARSGSWHPKPLLRRWPDTGVKFAWLCFRCQDAMNVRCRTSARCSRMAAIGAMPSGSFRRAPRALPRRGSGSKTAANKMEPLTGLLEALPQGLGFSARLANGRAWLNRSRRLRCSKARRPFSTRRQAVRGHYVRILQVLCQSGWTARGLRP